MERDAGTRVKSCIIPCLAAEPSSSAHRAQDMTEIPLASVFNRHQKNRVRLFNSVHGLFILINFGDLFYWSFAHKALQRVEWPNPGSQPGECLLSIHPTSRQLVAVDGAGQVWVYLEPHPAASSSAPEVSASSPAPPAPILRRQCQLLFPPSLLEGRRSGSRPNSIDLYDCHLLIFQHIVGLLVPLRSPRVSQQLGSDNHRGSGSTPGFGSGGIAPVPALRPPNEDYRFGAREYHVLFFSSIVGACVDSFPVSPGHMVSR